MCEYEAKSLENLDMHLFTCEHFQCNWCEVKTKHSKEIKTHVETVHDNECCIQHIKMSRNIENEVSIKLYNSDEI